MRYNVVAKQAQRYSVLGIATMCTLGSSGLVCVGHSEHEDAVPNAIIYNGDFSVGKLDRGQVAFDHWSWIPAENSHSTWVSDIGEFGKSSPSLEMSLNKSKARMIQALHRIPRGRIVVRGLFKNDPGIGTVEVALQCSIKGRRKTERAFAVHNKPSESWSSFEVYFDLPSGTTVATLELSAAGCGRVWFDDIVVDDD